MKVAWGNFLEDMGTRLLPALDAVQGAIIQYVLPSGSYCCYTLHMDFSESS
jgi:hypothetical protein